MVKTLISAGIIWEIDVVATQPVGAPASMGILMLIPEGERGLLLGGAIGADNYGAGRVISAILRKNGVSSGYYTLLADTIDNQILNITPIITNISSTTTTPSVVGLPYMPFIIPELVNIQIIGASLANAETLTARIWLATRVFPPTISANGTGVTLTTNNITQV